MRFLPLLLLCGCAPYAEIGVGYQLDSHSAWTLRTEREWQCSNPQFHGEVGLEFEHQWTLAYHHQSWVGCGDPLNNKPELYQDHIQLSKKFGGLE
jgi:hypothetical protein